LRGSDAHQPEEVGRAWTRLLMAKPVFEEFRMALQGKDGRQVIGGEA
jgi:PHP family Zn ribbon phosphoesterase